MTTNENNNGNKTLIIAIFLAILGLVIFFKGCNGSKEVIQVTIPEVKGNFKAVKPLNKSILVQKLSTEATSVSTEVNGSILRTENEFLQSEIDRLLKEYNSLNKAFASANDSLQQIIYTKAIAPKLFKHTFDNDTLSATVKGIVANGEVDKLNLDYTIKSRTIDMKVPQVKFRLLAGVEVGATKDFDKFNTKVNLGFQNKKGDVISISADTDKRFYIGYQFSIFSIKK
jgi:hypothetical protein